ncbi:MAG: spermidine synthase [Gallionellales bacterium CG_4_10_14_3_um_filter_54_96]|nr:MAG: spermidine synthase [Gallionellales bacterium CG17_big_fil_post_rev_8_21_14_2_50_54_146]PIX04862.1 MAG: spermidine synthase [Gallionellales bacterium CG_4_8_14_3_um_filter_54_18]PIY06316.1 MAG: spermidine synthase [Gallionellales bacterium CG_4_10_14_3_um_filter_54_96]
MTTPIDISEAGGVRFLHFGSEWVQGAMRIARPWNLELEYTREMMAALLLRDAARWPRKVLLIGLGAASLTKFLYRYRPESHLTIVEIEPAVVSVAQHYFKLPEDDKRIHLVVGDGAEFVLGTDKKFDLILVDGFDEDAHPGQLNTQPFYQACRSCLSDQGLLAVNLIDMQHGEMGGFAHILSAFDDRALTLPSCESGNTIAFATDGDPVAIPLDDMQDRILALKEETGMDLSPMLARLLLSQTCLNHTFTL